MEEIYTSNLADGTTNETQEPLTLEDAQINALSTLAETAGTLSRAVQKIAAYVPTQWVDNSEPSITASRLMHIENGIKDATNAVNNAIDSITSLTGQVTDLNGRREYLLEYTANKYFQITENMDLNNLKTPGVYSCGLVSIVNTLKNCPCNHAFKMIVEKISSNDTITSQKIVAGNFTQFSPYIRTYDSNNNWGQWGQLATNGTIPKGKYDLDNPPSYSIFQAIAGSTNLPPELGGNAAFVLQLVTENILYGTMLVFGFGSDKIAIRRKSNSEQWSSWKYFSVI